jgi:dynein heavy chain
VTAEIMMKVEDVLLSPEYSYEKAYTASRAATGIFKWIKATRDYFYLFKELEPRRDAFLLSQKQYSDKYDTLQSKQTKISQLDSALVGLKEHQQSKDEIIEELRNEINDCSIRKKRADLLLRGLRAEKQKWVVCIRMLAQKYHSVAGDVLLTSGFITLLGGLS